MKTLNQENLSHLRRNPNTETYSKLYDNLALVYSGSMTIEPIFFSFILVVPSLLVTYSQLLETDFQWFLGLLAIPLLFIGSSYLFLIMFSLVSTTRNPSRSVSRYVARMLIMSRRPYSQGDTGLNYKDIVHLRKIAEIEQSAAEWRGVFINIIIIGTISVLFAAGKLLWNLGPSASSQESVWPQVFLAIFPDWLMVVTSISLIIFITWIFFRVFTYLMDFFASESANRLILKACEESLALLESRTYEERDRLSLKEKHELASLLDCRLVSESAASFLDKTWSRFKTPDGRTWYLVPTSSDSRIATLIQKWNRYLKRKTRLRM